MESAVTDEGTLEVITFLARSPNRVRVLAALTDGPIGRYDLEESADVTRATLGRILDDFHDRGWVSEADRQYDATPLGTYVSRELTTVLRRLAPVPALADVAEWLPPAGFDFDLSHLAGAKIVRSTKRDALAPTAHIAGRIRGAEEVNLLTYAVLPDVMEACWRGVIDAGLAVEAVLADDVLGRVGNDPRMVDQAREMVVDGTATVFVSDADIPTTVFVVDDTVLLCLSGESGAPLAVIETEDGRVCAWAEATIATHREEGTRLDPSRFSG